MQDAITKAAVQSESIPAKSNSVFTGIKTITGLNKDLLVYNYQKELYIKQHLLPANQEISLYNVNGELVLIKTMESTFEKVNLSNLNDGIYFYSITTNGRIEKTGKLCVQ